MRGFTGLVASAGLAAGLITGSATASPPVRLPGSAVPFTVSLPSTGLVPGSQRLTIQVWLAPRDPAGAARYAMAVSTPGSPLFHHFLPPDAYTSRFGAATAEAAAVAGWLRGAGFASVGVGEQRSYVRATAPVSVIDAALGVRLRYYRATAQVNAGPYRLRANDRAVRVPAALAPGVLAVTGLDNQAPHLPLAHPAAAARPAAIRTAASHPAVSRKIPCSHYYGQHRVTHLPRKFGVTTFDTSLCGYTAWQLRQVYGANRSDDGRGQTIALVELGLTKDMFLTLQDYARTSGLPAPSRSRYTELELGRRSCPDAFNIEEQLDVESAYDMALGAHELVVGGDSCNSDFFQELCDALTRILGGNGHHPLASIASNSWEDPSPVTAAQKRLSHSILVRAAAEGVGMYFSTNDNPGVRSPSQDPFATAVGGTSLAISQGGRWLSETGWSTGVAGIRKHHWTRPFGIFAAGGGASPLWAEPAYQKGVVPPALSRHGASRSIPDLSAVADPTTGIKLGLLIFPKKKSPPRYVTIIEGGTSLATPLLAGLVADAQQGHAPFGFLNPVFYRLAGTAAFHDVLPAAALRPVYRAVICATSSDLCAFGGPGANLNLFDFQARGFTRQVTLKGYDTMTGIGSPNGRVFIDGLRRLAG